MIVKPVNNLDAQTKRRKKDENHCERDVEERKNQFLLSISILVGKFL